MELTDEQKQVISGWVDEGAGLSEIQRRLADELGIKMTYMDVRFLVMDLGLSVREKERPAEKKPEESVAGVEPDAQAPDAAGSVAVEVDRVTQPGAVISGSVTFSDGRSGTWMLDQTGRLALDTGDPNYRPSREDVETFQTRLRESLEQGGY